MAYALLLFVPLSLVLRYLVDAPPTWVFLTSVVAIAVLADWIRRATEQLAERAGSTIGSLLNVSFGNTAELVLALFILRQAHPWRATAGKGADRHERSAHIGGQHRIDQIVVKRLEVMVRDHPGEARSETK